MTDELKPDASVYLAAEKAWADTNHEQLCACAAWPDNCAFYLPAEWATDATDVATDVGFAAGVAAERARIADALRGPGIGLGGAGLADLIDGGEI